MGSRYRYGVISICLDYKCRAYRLRLAVRDDMETNEPIVESAIVVYFRFVPKQSIRDHGVHRLIC